jgi:CheY-like chemotaxis protein
VNPPGRASTVRQLPQELSGEVRHRGFHGTKVIVVDDSGSARSILGKILRSLDAGISMVDFATAEDALVWLENSDCDLVITDYLMPGMDGMELARAVRAHPRLHHIPVIMITVEPSVRSRALQCGVSQFLTKRGCPEFRVFEPYFSERGTLWQSRRNWLRSC